MTISSHFGPVKCSIYRSTISRGRNNRLLLNTRQVLETSYDLYRESTGLFRAMINLYTGVLVKSTASWI